MPEFAQDRLRHVRPSFRNLVSACKGQLFLGSNKQYSTELLYLDRDKQPGFSISNATFQQPVRLLNKPRASGHLYRRTLSHTGNAIVTTREDLLSGMHFIIHEAPIIGSDLVLRSRSNPIIRRCRREPDLVVSETIAHEQEEPITPFNSVSQHTHDVSASTVYFEGLRSEQRTEYASSTPPTEALLSTAEQTLYAPESLMQLSAAQQYERGPRYSRLFSMAIGDIVDNLRDFSVKDEIRRLKAEWPRHIQSLFARETFQSVTDSLLCVRRILDLLEYAQTAIPTPQKYLYFASAIISKENLRLLLVSLVNLFLDPELTILAIGYVTKLFDLDSRCYTLTNMFPMLRDVSLCLVVPLFRSICTIVMSQERLSGTAYGRRHLSVIVRFLYLESCVGIVTIQESGLIACGDAYICPPQRTRFLRGAGRQRPSRDDLGHVLLQRPGISVPLDHRGILLSGLLSNESTPSRATTYLSDVEQRAFSLKSYLARYTLSTDVVDNPEQSMFLLLWRHPVRLRHMDTPTAAEKRHIAIAAYSLGLRGSTFSRDEDASAKLITQGNSNSADEHVGQQSNTETARHPVYSKEENYTGKGDLDVAVCPSTSASTRGLHYPRRRLNSPMQMPESYPQRPSTWNSAVTRSNPAPPSSDQCRKVSAPAVNPEQSLWPRDTSNAYSNPTLMTNLAPHFLQNGTASLKVQGLPVGPPDLHPADVCTYVGSAGGENDTGIGEYTEEAVLLLADGSPAPHIGDKAAIAAPSTDIQICESSIRTETDGGYDLFPEATDPKAECSISPCHSTAESRVETRSEGVRSPTRSLSAASSENDAIGGRGLAFLNLSDLNRLIEQHISNIEDTDVLRHAAKRQGTAPPQAYLFYPNFTTAITPDKRRPPKNTFRKRLLQSSPRLSWPVSVNRCASDICSNTEAVTRIPPALGQPDTDRAMNAPTHQCDPAKPLVLSARMERADYEDRSQHTSKLTDANVDQTLEDNDESVDKKSMRIQESVVPPLSKQNRDGHITRDACSSPGKLFDFPYICVRLPRQGQAAVSFDMWNSCDPVCYSIVTIGRGKISSDSVFDKCVQEPSDPASSSGIPRSRYSKYAPGASKAELSTIQVRTWTDDDQLPHTPMCAPKVVYRSALARLRTVGVDAALTDDIPLDTVTDYDALRSHAELFSAPEPNESLSPVPRMSDLFRQDPHVRSVSANISGSTTKQLTTMPRSFSSRPDRKPCAAEESICRTSDNQSASAAVPPRTHHLVAQTQGRTLNDYKAQEIVDARTRIPRVEEVVNRLFKEIIQETLREYAPPESITKLADNLVDGIFADFTARSALHNHDLTASAPANQCNPTALTRDAFWASKHDWTKGQEARSQFSSAPIDRYMLEPYESVGLDDQTSNIGPLSWQTRK